MKKLMLALLVVTMLLSLFPGIGLAGPSAVVPKLYLNGEQLKSEVEPQMIKGMYTVVPIRIVSESIGYEVEWNQASKLVTIHNGNDEIILQIDDSSALVNQSPVQMDVPAIVQNGVTLIPLRFVGEQLGLKVEWDQQTKSVYLTQEVQDNPAEPEEEQTEEPDKPEQTEDSGSGTSSAGGTVTSVAVDDEGAIVLAYRGEVEPDKPFKLDNPQRIVLDLPDADFAPELLDAPDKALSLPDHPYAGQVRYSLFANDPPAVRLVFDLTADAGIKLENGDGQLRIVLTDPAQSEAWEPDPDDKEPEQQPVVPDKPYTVVIDAGHGGEDPGAKGVNGNWESELNLSLSLKVKELLDQEPYITPLLSRPEDKYVTLPGRVAFAEQNGADLFVSIHGNSDPKGTATGTETYYTRDDSRAFAEAVHKELAAATGLKDRGVRKQSLHVTRETTMPAILLETGFLSNPSDVEVLFDEEAQYRMAEAIVAGIKHYLNLP